MIKRLLAALLAFLAMSALAAVDVNKATAAELDAVKGIGPAIAGKITAERAKGAFKDWPDLISRVSGIGEKSAAKLSENGLVVNGVSFSGAPPAPAKAAAKTPAAAPAATTAAAPAAPPAATPAATPAVDAKQAKKEAAEAKAAAKAEAKAKAKADKDKAAADKAAAKADAKAQKTAKAADAAASAAKK